MGWVIEWSLFPVPERLREVKKTDMGWERATETFYTTLELSVISLLITDRDRIQARYRI